MTWLTGMCPMCGHPVLELPDNPGAEARGRCRGRDCRSNKVRVHMRVTAQHTIVALAMDPAPAKLGIGKATLAGV